MERINIYWAQFRWPSFTPIWTLLSGQSSLSSSNSWGVGARPLLRQLMSHSDAGDTIWDTDWTRLVGNWSSGSCLEMQVTQPELLEKLITSSLGWGGGELWLIGILTNFNRRELVHKFFSFPFPQRWFWHAVVHVISSDVLWDWATLGELVIKL